MWKLIYKLDALRTASVKPAFSIFAFIKTQYQVCIFGPLCAEY